MLAVSHAVNLFTSWIKEVKEDNMPCSHGNAKNKFFNMLEKYGC